MRVVHFNRKRRPFANYSIEGFYKNIRNELASNSSIRTVDCQYKSNGFFRRLYNCIYAALRQADVNHVTGDVNYLNLFFKKNKNIITILDCGLLNRVTGIKRFIARFFWYSIPIARAEYVVAISQATKYEILKYVKCDPKKIKVIYVSISPVFHRSEKEFNKQKPVILHVGTAPNKNLSRLINALAGLNCKLVIIGKLNDIYLKALDEYKIDYENFIDLTDEEVFEQYKSCDMLAFVSTYEGFGMPIIEANTVGRAVITSNLLSMPEIAEDAALLVNPYDIDEIRNGITKIIEDDDYRNYLINKGFQNLKKFSIEKIANEYYELYVNVLNGNAKK